MDLDNTIYCIFHCACTAVSALKMVEQVSKVHSLPSVLLRSFRAEVHCLGWRLDFKVHLVQSICTIMIAVICSVDALFLLPNGRDGM
jgi:hypothetical protein